MSEPEVVVHDDADELATATAARLVTALVAAQARRGSVSLVLTGGRIGIAVLERLRAHPDRDDVDWSTVDIYWGDERFLPAGHPDRNETQARAALLDHVPATRVFPIAPSDGPFGDDPDAAARAYADLLADVSSFDVFLVGVGEEGHTLSVFPDSPAVHERELSVVAVRDCPKPPPTRVSLTLATARRATDLWLVTAGGSKADPVAAALSGADEVAIPAAGARGTEQTLWLLDTAAAAKLQQP
ncbi:6-phosphogluconolactonase [Actinokineospora sp. NBRC 105648]|uniref:6-phosphogluconolactonase n=1 Tax=Actinokineospora sp. NBRC 105648 TaxID=3032206 RepID=UPI0024A45A2F|nr:6-phosphogluconolactonase [Actinokineospora sp. NBRC 105648]GLZ36961.1 6-phosphogluconolactonase [Actinokineospora sp. NBRC 105648]